MPALTKQSPPTPFNCGTYKPSPKFPLRRTLPSYFLCQSIFSANSSITETVDQFYDTELRIFLTSIFLSHLLYYDYFAQKNFINRIYVFYKSQFSKFLLLKHICLHYYDERFSLTGSGTGATFPGWSIA